MEVKTGQVKAIANLTRSEEGKYWERYNYAVGESTEPGSTFKALTIASALEHKIARPDTNYYCEHGKLRVEGHTISEAEAKKKFEWLSVTEILQHSSNVGTTKIAFDLTYPKLKETLKKFKIGDKTGIELSGESRGIFNDEENVSPLSLSNISFGQGVATTGIQMLAAYSALSNGGYYIKPTILKRDKDKIAESDKTQIIDFQTSRELKDMLVEAVEDGTGGRAKVNHFTIDAIGR